MAGRGVYIAQDRLLVGHELVKGDDGEPLIEDGRFVMKDIYREPGELVPEADSWTDVESWLRNGKVALVPEAMVQLQARVDQLEARITELENAKTPRRGGTANG